MSLRGLSWIKNLNSRRFYAAIKLRDYQIDAIDKCMEAINEGSKRIGVSMATGGGKTVIFSNLIDKLKQESGKSDFKALVLVHRRELANQAGNTIKRAFPNARVQLEMGKQHTDIEQSDVIIASVQSLIRRLDKYKKDDIDLIIIDEAHHSVAKSYVEILRYFNANSPSSKIPVVGFSATFERADNKALSEVIDKIVYHRGILDMIDDKWLCEGKFTTVKIKTDLSKVEKSYATDDFKIDSLSKVMNTPEVNKIILMSYLHQRKEHNVKSALLFGVDVAHVKSLHELFVSNGINAKDVTGRTKDEIRDSYIKDFKDGKIEVLMNCGIFTEGTDMPNIDCILLCRPTRSRSLLVQMIGRGLRLHHSKDYCHIMDFVDSSNVGVISIPTLAGIAKYDGTLDEATLEDLDEIKNDINEKNRIAKEKAFQKEKLEEEAYNADYMKFKDFVSKSDAFDLTMTTYETLSKFYQQTNKIGSKPVAELSLFGKEQELLIGSNFPWVKFARSAWALSLQGLNHLRIYKELDKINEKKYRYTLKLYREIPKFARNKSGIKFIPRELLKSYDLLDIIGKVDEVINGINSISTNRSSPPVTANFTKFARWRRDKATTNQTQFILRILKASYIKHREDYSNIDSHAIEQYVNGMDKGTASNILFATRLASSYPISQLLKALNYKQSHL